VCAVRLFKNSRLSTKLDSEDFSDSFDADTGNSAAVGRSSSKKPAAANRSKNSHSNNSKNMEKPPKNIEEAVNIFFIISLDVTQTFANFVYFSG
jgi:hypothetical protein